MTARSFLFPGAESAGYLIADYIWCWIRPWSQGQVPGELLWAPGTEPVPASWPCCTRTDPPSMHDEPHHAWWGCFAWRLGIFLDEIRRKPYITHVMQSSLHSLAQHIKSLYCCLRSWEAWRCSGRLNTFWSEVPTWYQWKSIFVSCLVLGIGV